jgi:hypothetical protein
LKSSLGDEAKKAGEKVLQKITTEKPNEKEDKKTRKLREKAERSEKYQVNIDEGDLAVAAKEGIKGTIILQRKKNEELADLERESTKKKKQKRD